MVGVVGVLSLAAPEPAAASVGDVIGAGLNAITGAVGKAAVESFEAIVKVLFAWPAKMINRELLAWMVAVPDYAIDPDTGGGSHGSNLAELGATTTTMAFAALGAVGT